ncbi:hypothetical protein D3C75_823970 [compost metagenome]
MGGPLHGGVEHDYPPCANIRHRLHQLRRHLCHDPGLVVVARQPAGGHGKRRSQIPERFIRSNAGVLGQITRAQQQVDKRLLAPHLGHYMAQAVTGIEAQHAAGRVGEQVGIGQLHHMHGARLVWLRQRPSPRTDSAGIMAGQRSRANTRTRPASHFSAHWPVRDHKPGSGSAIHRGTG